MRRRLPRLLLLAMLGTMGCQAGPRGRGGSDITWAIVTGVIVMALLLGFFLKNWPD